MVTYFSVSMGNMVITRKNRCFRIRIQRLAKASEIETHRLLSRNSIADADAKIEGERDALFLFCSSSFQSSTLGFL